MRASICVIVDNPAKFAAANAWFAENGCRLTFISENTGCGCCVDFYDVEGPEEVVCTIPSELVCSSDWSQGRTGQGRQGNDWPKPFIRFEPAWLSVNVIAIARLINETLAFEQLPVLADALEEAGCNDGEMLAHLRGRIPHARACHIVDGILQK